MSNDAEIERKFWKALRSDMTLMIGLANVDEAHTRPMTAQFDGDGDHGPLYFFTSSDTELAAATTTESRSVASFTSKGHDVFATIHGTLSLEQDAAVIDRLWNPHVAAWFDGGRDDPKLRVLRFAPERAQIWVDASSFLAGVKVMLGMDPKADYKVAQVSLA